MRTSFFDSINFPPLRIIARGLSEVVNSPLFQRMATIAGRILPFTFAAYFIGYGVGEMVCDFEADLVQDSDLDESEPDKVKDILDWFYERIRAFEEVIPYGIVHGALFIGTGAVELLISLFYVGVDLLAKLVPVLFLIGEITFIGACLLMLIHNVKMLILAQKIINTTDNQILKEKAEYTRTVAILSILSAITYIVGTALAMAGAGPAWIVLFMMLGLAFGATRIFLDLHKKYFTEAAQI